MAEVDANELENAMILMDSPGSGEAWVCRRTGKVIMRSDMIDAGEAEAVPDDIDDDYRRFSNFLHDSGLTERWHTLRDQRTLAAMHAWCEENGLLLAS